MSVNRKLKVLQVTSGFRKGVSGGIPSVIHNYCTSEAFDQDVHFDYLALGYQTFEPYREDLEKNGGKLYCLDIHATGIKQLVCIYFRLKEFIKNHQYDIIHINSGALTQVLACCKAAKDAGSKCVIAHSHNAINKTGIKGIVYNNLKPLFVKYADAWFACSRMAAESMFPDSILNNNRWVLIPNAIEMKNYAFNEEIREKYRKELGIENKYVVGHVGRFNEQKNHRFLIDVFSKMISIKEDAVLLLVGEGALRSDIQRIVEEKGISDKVIFTGQRSDANNLMQAMDIFAFPSLFEGLGMVLIEAQVAGLKVIASDSLPKEAEISKNIKFIESDPNLWVELLCKNTNDDDRKAQSKEAIDNGQNYELSMAAIALKKIYFHLIQTN